MTRIIGLIDGSTYARSVCDHIAWIAGRTEVTVEILHVIGRLDLSSEPVNLSGNIGLGARTALLEELADLDAQKAKVAHARGRLLLDEAKAHLQAAGVPNVETRLRNGDLVETVQEFEANADIIVIGKRGEGADAARGPVGSNLERVVRSTRKAIVIAPHAFRPVSKLLIAYDGGALAIKTVDQVARSPVLDGLGVKLVTVGSDTPESRKKLEDAAAILKAAGFEAQTAMIDGQTGTAITAIVEQEGYDLLAMGAYSHSRLRSLFIGSTTTEMIRSCKVPIVIFR